jgi:hypothetical protein
MRTLLDYPRVLGIVFFFVLWGAEKVGAHIVARWRRLQDDDRDGFNIILGATLTLLGLIIGFAFSMAVGRYDQRKAYEEEEANAIGTEYVRLDLLPPDDAAKLRPLLLKYLASRIDYYQTRGGSHLTEINQEEAKLQNDMWTAVQSAANARPTPLTALAVAGMNDVLNRQGYTQAAWWNRIPGSAWTLMAGIAICCSVLVGYQGGSIQGRTPLIVLPIVLSISFVLLADLDSPRGGIIRVSPQNLISLSDSLTVVR